MYEDLLIPYSSERDMINALEELQETVLFNIHRLYETDPSNHRVLDTMWVAYENLCKSVLQLKQAGGITIPKDIKGE
jgi:hypothetical protein